MPPVKITVTRMKKKFNNTKHSKLKTFLLSFIQKEKDYQKINKKGIPGIVTNYFS